MAASVSEEAVIDAALSHFRQDLESRKQRQEEQYPRHGKNAATADDLSNDANDEERLRILQRLLEDPKRYASQLQQITPIEPPQLKAQKPAIVDEEPYCNPFTGEWIIPNSSLTPGPSKAPGPLYMPGQFPDDLSPNMTGLRLTPYLSKETTKTPSQEPSMAGDTKSKQATDHLTKDFSSHLPVKMRETKSPGATVSVAGPDKDFGQADTNLMEYRPSRPPSYKTAESLRSISSSTTLPSPRNFSAPKSYEITPDQTGGTLTRLMSFASRKPFRSKRKGPEDTPDGFQLPPPKQTSASTLTLPIVSSDKEGFGRLLSSVFSKGDTAPPAQQMHQVSGSSVTTQKGAARVEGPQIAGKTPKINQQPRINKLANPPPKAQRSPTSGTEKDVGISTFPILSHGKTTFASVKEERNNGSELRRPQTPQPQAPRPQPPQPKALRQQAAQQQAPENVIPSDPRTDGIQASLELATNLALGVPQHYESLKWMEDDPFGINEGITGEWPSTPYSDSLRVALELSRGVPQDYSTLQSVQLEAHKESLILARSLASGLPQEYSRLQELFDGDQALARQLSAEDAAHNALLETDREIAQRLAAEEPQELEELRAAESAGEADRIREAKQARELSEQLDKAEFEEQLAYARRLQQRWDAESSGSDSQSISHSTIDIRYPPLSPRPATASPITPLVHNLSRLTTPALTRPTAPASTRPVAASSSRSVAESPIKPTVVKQLTPRDLLGAEEADLVAQQRERQTRWAADAQRRQQAANQEDARIRKEREELAALEKDRQRRETAEKAARRALQLECVVCSDPADRSEMVVLPCKHAYDRNCVTECFRRALASKKRFTCCKKAAPVDSAAKFLNYKLLTAYRALVVELDTPNPTYCSRGTCSTFIPPANIQGTLATCPRCARKTCQLCKKTEHPGICSADKDGKALIALGSKNLWQTCPHCKNLVERSAGCLHMTCTCGTQFCYNCGRKSRQCSGTCARRS